jgi:hypothetical protein
MLGFCQRKNTDPWEHAMAQPKLDIRYDAEAVHFMDVESNRFYDLWLSLATEHALHERRTKVLKQDAEATLREAVDRIARDEPAP